MSNESGWWSMLYAGIALVIWVVPAILGFVLAVFLLRGFGWTP